MIFLICAVDRSSNIPSRLQISSKSILISFSSNLPLTSFFTPSIIPVTKLFVTSTILSITALLTLSLDFNVSKYFAEFFRKTLRRPSSPASSSACVSSLSWLSSWSTLPSSDISHLCFQLKCLQNELSLWYVCLQNAQQTLKFASNLWYLTMWLK